MRELYTEAAVAISRVNSGNSLVMAQTIPQFMSNLAAFAQADAAQAESMQEDVFSQVAMNYGFEYSRGERDKPFVYQDGIAIIPVRGVLLNRFSYSWSWATGYNFIRTQLNAVLNDLKVNGGDVELVVFDNDTPGGEAVGCFELAAEIMEARQFVPMISVVDSLSASAGYALASAATRMVCTPSGSVGSIGVYRLHMDISKYLEQAGINYTIFQAGEHKTDGHPYGPVSEAVAKDFQRSVEKRWDEFIAVVAEQRSMSEESVRDTQARVYRADEALDLRLIDAVNTPREAVSDFLAELASDDPFRDGDEDMALPKNEAEYQAALNTARQEGVASVQTPDVNAERTAAVTADRQRRQQIMALPEAESRQKLANTLADGDYTVDQAKALLAAAGEEKPKATTETPAGDAVSTDPKAKPGETVSEFQKRMETTESPNLAANDLSGGGKPDGEMSDADKTAAILGDQKRFHGTKHRSFGQKQA